VTVYAPASVIVKRVPPDVAVEPLDDHSCVVHAHASTPDALAFYLGLLDADFAVSEPPELVACLARLASRFWAASGESPPPVTPTRQ
jgi:hypothetical protein